MMHQSDVLIIGAGPAGTVAGAMLARQGLSVTILERARFPRFSIGESLLPQCMAFLDTAGLLPAAQAAGFQPKDGAVIATGTHATTFRFREKSAAGWNATWQVERARFDQVLAEAATVAGVRIRFGETITTAMIDDARSVLHTTDDDGVEREYHARFTLDASGAGRVLARRLSLESPNEAPPHAALFAHVADHISAPDYDRRKILLGIHPEHDDIWYWLIPFPTRASVGVVGPVNKLGGEHDVLTRLRAWIGSMPLFAHLLAGAQWDSDAREMRGYAATVKRLYGPGYALLGNAGGFLDPVFSSGVTMAMKSAVLAATLLERQLRGATPNWETGFERPVRDGAEVFRSFIEAWYRGELQKIFFAPRQPDTVRKHLCSILAGYVWDRTNPYTRRTAQRLTALAQACS